MTHGASLSCWETKSFQMTDCKTPRLIYAEWVWWKYGDLRTRRQASSESARSLGLSTFYSFHCFHCSVADCNRQLRSSYLRISKHTWFLLIQQSGFSHGKRVSVIWKQASKAAIRSTFIPTFIMIAQAVSDFVSLILWLSLCLCIPLSVNPTEEHWWKACWLNFCR